MPRTSMSPDEMIARHWRCYELNRNRFGVREIARQIGCTGGAVSRWLKAWDGGEPPPPVWDHHSKSGGRKWHETKARRERDAKRRALIRTAAPADLKTVLLAELDKSLRSTQEWEGEHMVERLHNNLAMDAALVTRGRFTTWTTAALRYAFGLTLAAVIDEDLFATPAEREAAVDVVLTGAARRAGCVEGSDRVWRCRT